MPLNTEQAASLMTKEQLIRAGLAELKAYGFLNFSTRRVAKNCGLSCATPYKHFNDTEDFITQILQYVSDQYSARIQETLADHADEDIEHRLIAIAMTYVQFNLNNPDFANAYSIPVAYRSLHRNMHIRFRDITTELLEEYFAKHPADEEARMRKIFAARSIVYGATILIGRSNAENIDAGLELVRQLLWREATLP